MRGVTPVTSVGGGMTSRDLAALRQDLGRRREELEKRRANLDEVERLLGELYPDEWAAALEPARALPTPTRRPRLEAPARRDVPLKRRQPSKPKAHKPTQKALPPPASVPALVKPRHLHDRVRAACMKLKPPFTRADVAEELGLEVGTVTVAMGQVLRALVREGVLDMETRLGRTGNIYWPKGKRPAAETKPAPAQPREAPPPRALPPPDVRAPTKTQRELVLTAARDARGTFTTAELAVMTGLDRKTVSAVVSVLAKEALLALIRQRPDGGNIYEITTVGRRAVG